MTGFHIGAAFRATMAQVQEAGLPSLFLCLISFVSVIALVVVLSFAVFSGFSMFDMLDVGAAGALGILAALVMLVFFGAAYCAAVMSMFRHTLDGQRADFVTSLIFGWKAAFPIIGVMVLLYIAVAFVFGIVFAMLALVFGGLASAIDLSSGLSDLSVGLIVLIALLYLLFFVIIGLFIPARFGLAGPIMAAHQRLNPFWAMGQSWTMTRGNSLKLMGYLFLIGLAWLLLYFLITILAIGLEAAGFAYGSFLTIYPFMLAYTILYNMVISGIYFQLSGGGLLGEEQIADVFG